MNAERLHAVARDIRAELVSTEQTPKLEQLAAELSNAATSPQQPAHQQNVSALRSELEALLTEADSDDFSPAWRQVVEELGADDLLGERLRDRLEAIFLRNEITPSAAAAEVSEIASELRTFETTVTELVASLEGLGVGAEQLAAGDFELGFLIPRKEVDDEMGELGRELVRLKALLGPFLELSVGGRPDLVVRSISSSDFMIFLLASAPTALMIAKTMESLVTSYEKLTSIRLNLQALKDNGVPEDALDSVKEHAGATMSEGIESLAQELIEGASSPPDPGRANELRVELKLSLNGLANRIDRGFNVEVRAGEVEAPRGDEPDEGDDPELEAQREAARLVKAKQRELRFRRRDGHPILELPEPRDATVEPKPAAGGRTESRRNPRIKD